MQSYITSPSSANVIPLRQQTTPAAGQSDRFLKLRHELMNSSEWQNLPPGPRAAYIAIAARHNGQNNGRISFSERDGVAELHANRRTVRRWFQQLEEPGIAVRTHRGSFDFKAKEGKASLWYLPDLDGKPPNRTPGLPQTDRPIGHEEPHQADTRAPSWETPVPHLKNRSYVDLESKEGSLAPLPDDSLASPQAKEKEEASEESEVNAASNSNKSFVPINPLRSSARPPSRWRTANEERRADEEVIERYRRTAAAGTVNGDAQ